MDTQLQLLMMDAVHQENWLPPADLEDPETAAAAILVARHILENVPAWVPYFNSIRRYEIACAALDTLNAMLKDRVIPAPTAWMAVQTAATANRRFRRAWNTFTHEHLSFGMTQAHLPPFHRFCLGMEQFLAEECLKDALAAHPPARRPGK